MIGRLSGVLLEKQAPNLLIDVAGVAYEVQAPMSTFYQLPEVNTPVVLHTHLVTREDAQLLFGFFSKQERALFRSLIKVNGVGPKLAITILSGIEPVGFVRCISDNDTATLVRLPGVGKKTAERLIVEMRDRLSDWAEGELSMDNLPHQTAEFTQLNESAVSDAVSALIALGFKANDANKAVNKITDKNTLTSEELIKQALQRV
jgi:Holliday junction DNA helicase RuvA